MGFSGKFFFWRALGLSVLLIGLYYYSYAVGNYMCDPESTWSTCQNGKRYKWVSTGNEVFPGAGSIVYKKEELSCDAVCDTNPLSVYNVDPGITELTCTEKGKDGLVYRKFLKRSDLDSLTKVKEDPDGGRSCSEQIKPTSDLYPASLLIENTKSLCSTDAKCITRDRDVYTIPDATQICSDSKQQAYKKRSDLELLTTAPSYYGGKTCTQQISPISDKYPLSKCLSPMDAECNTNDLSVYTVLDATQTCSDPTQKAYKKRQDLDILTISAPVSGGKTCSQLISPTSATYPASKCLSPSAEHFRYRKQGIEKDVNFQGGIVGLVFGAFLLTLIHAQDLVQVLREMSSRSK